MPDGRKRILGPFTGRKKQKAWNKIGEFVYDHQAYLRYSLYTYI